MAYDINKLTRLHALKQLAERIKSDYVTVTAYSEEVADILSSIDTLEERIGEQSVSAQIESAIESALESIDYATEEDVQTMLDEVFNTK